LANTFNVDILPDRSKGPKDMLLKDFCTIKGMQVGGT